MGMSIDKAISWLLSIAEHEGEDIPIYDTDVEAIKMGIETMRRYQKIEKIWDKWHIDMSVKTNVAMSQIGEVLKNENDD